jgi:hypothetical protein
MAEEAEAGLRYFQLRYPLRRDRRDRGIEAGSRILNQSGSLSTTKPGLEQRK